MEMEGGWVGESGIKMEGRGERGKDGDGGWVGGRERDRDGG